MDEAIFNGVVLFNEYRLPPSFAPGDVVFDVGAHIGAFAHAVASRGCEDVYCVEADAENVELAAEHLRPSIKKGHVRLVHGAVWRSDPNEDELYFDGYQRFTLPFKGAEVTLNTGGGSVIWGAGTRVPKIAFDDVIDLLTNRGQKRIRLVKLDCEGSEWPVLQTSRRLQLIDEICGEFHEIGGEFPGIGEGHESDRPIFRPEGKDEFNIAALVSLLSDAGFAVTYKRHRRQTGAPGGVPEGLGLFFAKREDGQAS